MSSWKLIINLIILTCHNNNSYYNLKQTYRVYQLQGIFKTQNDSTR